MNISKNHSGLYEVYYALAVLICYVIKFVICREVYYFSKCFGLQCFASLIKNACFMKLNKTTTFVVYLF